MKKILILLLLPLFAFSVGHKFYLSVTNINYSEKDDSLQITTRIFIDDLEQVLYERYGIAAKLDTSDEALRTDEIIQKYLRAKFFISLNDEPAHYEFLGKRYEADMVICYLEVPKVDFPNLKNIGVHNEILTDLFTEQKNMVHFKIKDKKKSFILIQGDSKGMLNF